MMRALRSLLKEKSGIGAVEFALIVPLLITILVGVAEMGRLHFAHAGLRNLIAESARFASISPRPTDAAIKARLRAGGFGLQTNAIGEPTIVYDNTSGANSALITVTYRLQLSFLFWRPAPTTLTEQRRVFIYPAP